METEGLDLEKAFQKVDLRERAHRDNKLFNAKGVA